jgi:hypothetical protein
MPPPEPPAGPDPEPPSRLAAPSSPLWSESLPPLAGVLESLRVRDCAGITANQSVRRTGSPGSWMRILPFARLVLKLVVRADPGSIQPMIRAPHPAAGFQQQLPAEDPGSSWQRQAPWVAMVSPVRPWVPDQVRRMEDGVLTHW